MPGRVPRPPRCSARWTLGEGAGSGLQPQQPTLPPGRSWTCTRAARKDRSASVPVTASGLRSPRARLSEFRPFCLRPHAALTRGARAPTELGSRRPAYLPAGLQQEAGSFPRVSRAYEGPTLIPCCLHCGQTTLTVLRGPRPKPSAGHGLPCPRPWLRGRVRPHTGRPDGRGAPKDARPSRGRLKGCSPLTRRKSSGLEVKVNVLRRFNFHVKISFLNRNIVFRKSGVEKQVCFLGN